MADQKKSVGKNKVKCAKYSAAHHLERNKVRRLKRTIKHNTNSFGECNDECAKNALKEALKQHSGK